MIDQNIINAIKNRSKVAKTRRDTAVAIGDYGLASEYEGQRVAFDEVTLYLEMRNSQEIDDQAKDEGRYDFSLDKN